MFTGGFTSLVPVGDAVYFPFDYLEKFDFSRVVLRDGLY